MEKRLIESKVKDAPQRDRALEKIIERLSDLPKGRLPEFITHRLERSVREFEQRVRMHFSEVRQSQREAAERIERDKRLEPARSDLVKLIEDVKAIGPFDLSPSDVQRIASATEKADIPLAETLERAGLSDHPVVRAFHEIAKQTEAKTSAPVG